MITKRRWLWFLLFISVALILGILATGWNVVLMREYERILELAKNLSLPQELSTRPAPLFMKMTFGTLGFIAVLGLTLLIFARLLNEMRLNQIQSEFLATVSHELKTPIASIELSSSLIRTGGLTPHETEQLWNSHTLELSRLKEEVEALLEAARWQSKPLLTNTNPIILENWINQSMDQWRTHLGPGAILKREGAPLDLKISLDLRIINLIVNNLLNNARKFAKTTPEVIIRTSRITPSRLFSKPKWKIEFEDKGWGFNPADSKKIFHRFFRSRSSAPYSIPGTGLGLYLASSASKVMGLSLRGECSGEGRGAIFTLEGPESPPRKK